MKSVIRMISLFAMLALVVFFCLVTNRKFEIALPVVFCIWMFLLTVVAALNALFLVDWISIVILIVVIASLSYMIIYKKKSHLLRRARQNILTPGLAVFVVLAVALYYLCKPMVVWWADDVFYWALEPKGIWYLGGLSDSLGSIVDGFATYTPGIPVIQWQFLHFFNAYSENLLYYALYLSYSVFLLPLCNRISWRQWWLIPLFCVLLIVLPLLGNALAYTFLGVDTVLAACFAFVLITLWQDTVDPLPLLCGLCGLVLIKESGILLCVLALGFSLVKREKPKSLMKKHHSSNWLCWLAPGATLAAWAAYCLWKGYRGAGDGHTLAQLVSIMNGKFLLPENWNVIPASIWYAITHMPDAFKLLTALPWLPVPKIGWIVLLILFPMVLIRAYGRKPMLRLSLLVFLGSVCYLTFILLSFATTFNREIGAYSGENVNSLCLLLERYLAPLILGVGVLELWLTLGAIQSKKTPRFWKLGMLTFFSLIMVFCVNWASLGDTLVPVGYESRTDTVSVTAQTEETNFWSDALTDRAGAVVLIGFANDSEYIENLNYTFAPARFLLSDEACKDASSLTEKIRNQKVNYIVCLDDANMLYQGASQLTTDGYLDTYTLYAVVDDGVNITLESVE